MNKIIRLALVCVLFTACNNTSKDTSSKLDKAEWILGYWEMNAPESKVTESWIRTNDSTYSGVGKFMDSTGKVLSSEELRIVLRKDKLYYIPTVSNQNGGLPVSFAEVSVTDTMIVFENTQHDFPKRIAYIKKSPATILAYIEGEIEGHNERLEFDYEKK